MEIIRSVVPRDFESWLSLWEKYNSFYKRTILSEITKETWKRFLDPQEPVFAFVVEQESQIIGFVHYLFHRHTALMTNSCHLQDLYVLESARGHGVGTSLIELVADQATKAGSPSIYWMTQESNETARKLYDQVAKKSEFIVYYKRPEAT